MLEQDTSVRDQIESFDLNTESSELVAVVIGPPDTPYAGGRFHVRLQFHREYPFVAPTVQFLTRIFHPNIDPEHGAVCLSTLKTDWSPALTVTTVLLSIASLLADPNPDDPLSEQVADLMRRDHEAYLRTARIWTQRHATANSPDSLGGVDPDAPPSPIGP
jgi:ubiquitin-conjugating enzyme E2 D/E